jgi:hypothetical protein
MAKISDKTVRADGVDPKAIKPNPNTTIQPSKEESTEQNTESTEEVKGPEPDTEITVEYVSPEEVEYTVNDQLVTGRDPRQDVALCADTLSEIVKNHHVNPDSYSKSYDYNLLMHKIERLKSEVLKFIN